MKSHPTTDGLNPCPFCGKTPEIVREDVEPQGDRWYSGKIIMFVRCECGACMFDQYFHDGFFSPEEAAKRWNERVLS